MRRPAAVAALAAGAALLALPAAAPAASGPRVTTMVVGRAAVLAPAKAVRAPATRVAASGRRCAVGAGTPLAALVARLRGGPAIGLRDQGSCSRRPADAAALYVFRIGPDGERGAGGWVYKVGHRLATAGAADVAGPFGTGRRLRDGDRLLWFWCRSAARCQRTLDVAAPARVAPGGRLTVAVRGYDDQGRGVPVTGATVLLGGARATTGAGGRATLTAPRTRGAVALRVTRPGLVPAFPRRVAIG